MPEVIQRLDAFLAEISSLMKQTKVGVPLLNQKVEQWSQRVHVTLSNWGRGDDANRFTGAFYTTEQGYPISTLQNKVAARRIVLTALRDDIAEHQDFWETQLTPKRTEDRPTSMKEGINLTVHSAASQPILVLISHSSTDKALAEALIELLRLGLGLLANQIRCSSVDGYRLPAGVNTDDQLRAEINSVAVLVGLLTPNSLASTYVLFELGARWGAGLFMIPLLAGISAEKMRGPQRVLNALSCETQGQLIQLVEDIGKQLDRKPQSTASYLKQIKTVISLSEKIRHLPDTALSGKPDAEREEMEPFGPHNYFYRNGKTVGPYCPKCWQKDEKKVLLPASGDYAGGKGRVCTVCREFYLEEPRKGPLTIKPHGGQWS